MTTCLCRTDGELACKAKRQAPYNLSPDIEDALTWHCITSPSVLGMIFKPLCTGLLGQVHARRMIDAALFINATTGIGPESPTTVLEWLSAEYNQGRLSASDLDAVRAWVRVYKVNMDQTAVLSVVVPMLQTRQALGAAHRTEDMRRRPLSPAERSLRADKAA